MATGDIVRIGGGTDWSKKTFQTSAPTIADHALYTHIDVLGSGYIVDVRSVAIGSNMYYRIQIDGGSIYEVKSSSYTSTSGKASSSGGNFFPIRFNSSLKITGGTSSSWIDNVWVVLD
jgi:hypothetical protein